MKYIDADKLKNELESIYDNMLKRIKIDKDNSDYWGGKADAYRNVIDTITSRQQDQPEVEGKVTERTVSGSRPETFAITTKHFESSTLKMGDKVKVIVIKED